MDDMFYLSEVIGQDEVKTVTALQRDPVVRRDSGLRLRVSDEDGVYGEVFLPGMPMSIAEERFEPGADVKVKLRPGTGYLILA
tara:strand:+ start:610 stop:858 length:249 start_codon:yes stop_codon:yes gene_type:complete